MKRPGLGKLLFAAIAFFLLPRVAVAQSTDTDGDGLPDIWELGYFGTLDAGPGDDPDRDGLTNLSEYMNGTDPTKYEAKLTAGDGAAYDYFGRAVSISGDYVIVGAYLDDNNGTNSGSAYIFKREGSSWIQQVKLTAEDGAAYDYFGYAVSISGDYAIVGAYGDDDKGGSSGSAYIFKREGSSWTQQEKLTADDGAASDYFGWSVSISGDYAIVGAYLDDDNGTNSGSAYIFKREGSLWLQQAKLTAGDAAAYDYFGLSVSISGDYAIVGAYGDDDNATNSGSAYIFKREWSTWIRQAKLTAGDGAAYDYFGYSVCISGDYAVVGAYGDDDKGGNSGSAYIFKREGSSWTEQLKLTASDGTASDYFGLSVSISGDYAIVGAYGDDDKGGNSGSAYLFKREGSIWLQQEKLTGGDGAANDYFGMSVAISADYAMVGAHGDDDKGSVSGSVYIYQYRFEAKLSAFDGTSNGYFGRRVSICGDYAILGAYGDGGNGSYSGSAYIFKREGSRWLQQAKLTASDGAPSDYFGYAVSISGDYAIVGAIGDGSKGIYTGAAYIFKREGSRWVREAKLTASDGAGFAFFGHTVSISGDYAIVGAYGDDDKGSSSGSAYIFKREGSRWVTEAKLTASDGGAYDYFGLSVSISGDYAIVGACGDDDKGSSSGSAYIFKRKGSTWIRQVKLAGDDGVAYDYFGYAVSISGDYATVGAYGDDDKGGNSGSAYIFKREGSIWLQQIKLTAGDGAAADYFGYAVSISGDYAIVGAYGDDDKGSFSGSAYIFKREGSIWTEWAKLTAYDGVASDYFGYAVSISQNYAIVGAHFDDDKGSNSGSAYVSKVYVDSDDDDLPDSWELTYLGILEAGPSDDPDGDQLSNFDEYLLGTNPTVYEERDLADDDLPDWWELAYLGSLEDGPADDPDGDGFTNLSEYINGTDPKKNDGKLTASDGAAYDYFSHTAVSLSSDYAIVGAFGNADKGSYSGSAYIYKWEGSGWIQQAKLTARDNAEWDYFGRTVSISGDYAIVGAYGDDDKGSSSGSAYIFKREGSSWIEQAKLTAIDGAADDWFGVSVSISGEYAIVSAYGDDDRGIESGSAYVFKQEGSSWIQQAKLTASDGAAGNYFSISVSISGDYAIVGSYGDDDRGSSSGSAYIFEREGNNWIEQAKLTASDGAAGDYFGVSVSISGDYAVVGAHGDDNKGISSGSAYVFKREGSGWIQQAKLTASDGAADDCLGISVSIFGNYAVIGTPYDDDRGSSSGSVYIFARKGNSWVEQAKLRANDGAADDFFGRSVSISRDYAIVGAHGDDDNGSNSGSAYVIFLDMDLDALPDSWEFAYLGTLEAEPGDDPDGDRLTNANEYLLRTNPTIYEEPDTDHDGLPDWWELRYFGRLSQSRDSDYDGDGITNYIELKLLTSPIAARDRPDPGIRYEYDVLGRVISVIHLTKTSEYNYEIQYEYDRVGNRNAYRVHTVEP